MRDEMREDGETPAAREGAYSATLAPLSEPSKTDECLGAPQHVPPAPPPREPQFPDLPVRRDLDASVLGTEDEGPGASLGTALQLLALGPQNYVLDLNPEITFFKQVFRRHTPFALECFDDPVDLKFGSISTVELRRRGDVLGDVVLEIQLPNLGIEGGRWVDAIGYALLTRVRFLADGTVLNDQERLWYDITDKLFLQTARQAAVDAMIARGRTLATDRAHAVFVPLKLLCCRGHYEKQQFLPLVGLHRVGKLTLEFGVDALANCLVLPPGTRAPSTPAAFSARVLSEQAFLSQEEQRMLMRTETSMLVEVAQDVDALSYRFDDVGYDHVESAQLDLSEINLPLKLLAFVAYDENDAVNGLFFQYLDCVRRATVTFGSNERFSWRSGKYFSLVQTYQHCSRCADDRVHAYSFALDASQRQPSGSANMAAVEKPLLRVELDLNGTTAPVKIKAFAYCYNWLTVHNGYLQLRFT